MALACGTSEPHDASKCSDWGEDCCASDSWGEPQTCRDGYVPIASPREHCPSTYDGCKDTEGGIGCYGCYPPNAAKHKHDELTAPGCVGAMIGDGRYASLCVCVCVCVCFSVCVYV